MALMDYFCCIEEFSYRILKNTNLQICPESVIKCYIKKETGSSFDEGCTQCKLTSYHLRIIEQV